MNDKEFIRAFNTWFDKCQVLTSQSNSEFYKTTLEYEYLQKFIRIWVVGNGQSKSCFAFIALSDMSNKSLGSIKKGDVLRPATYQRPAKHARNNLFDESGGMSNMTQYGPAY